MPCLASGYSVATALLLCVKFLYFISGGSYVENNMQSFEYSDEMEDSATMCGKQKEPESDFAELRVLLLFLLLRQAMFKVADRAIVLLLQFFKLFLSGIGKMMHAEVLINFAKIIPETLYMI